MSTQTGASMPAEPVILDDDVDAERLSARCQFLSVSRAIAVGGIYAELHLPVEGSAWGGQRQIAVSVYPRPSCPVRVHAFTHAWPKPVDTYAPGGEAKAASYAAGLDRLTDLAAEWINRHVLPISLEAR